MSSALYQFLGSALDLSNPQVVSEEVVSWTELAPNDHLLHFYDDEQGFYKVLEGFVATGFGQGDSVILIPTMAHRDVINRRLEGCGMDLHTARREGRYFDPIAENFLANFMKEGWPDQQRFEQAMDNLFRQAGARGRRVRVFGEMVALLWGDGQAEATVRLEQLWTDFRRRHPFPLLCSYPKAGFVAGMEKFLGRICSSRTRLIVGRGGRPRAPA